MRRSFAPRTSSGLSRRRPHSCEWGAVRLLPARDKAKELTPTTNLPVPRYSDDDALLFYAFIAGDHHGLHRLTFGQCVREPGSFTCCELTVLTALCGIYDTHFTRFTTCYFLVIHVATSFVYLLLILWLLVSFVLPILQGALVVSSLLRGKIWYMGGFLLIEIPSIGL